METQCLAGTQLCLTYHVQVRLQPNPLLWGAIRAGNKHLLGSLTKITLAAYKTWPEKKWDLAGRPDSKRGWQLQQCGWRQIAAFQRNLGHKTDRAWYRWWESQNHYYPGFWLTYSIMFWGRLENFFKKFSSVCVLSHLSCPNLWDSTVS